MSDPTPTLHDDLPISENDIVFECPDCTKSLAIDRRGAGLTITCPGCGSPVRIPVPADATDMELFQDDGVEEVNPEELNQMLRLAKIQISQLATTLSDLSAQRRELEEARRQREEQVEKLRKEFANVQEALDRVAYILADIPPA